MKTRLVVCLLSLLCLVCPGMRAAYSLHNLSGLNNQLSNNAILCLHQDVNGFMWFGTYDGLNYYDGKTVTAFRYEPNDPHTLSGNTIHGIRELDADHLWVSTQSGLDKFSIKTRRVVESYPQYKQADWLVTDKQGYSWLIGKDDCLSRYDAQSGTFRDFHVPGLAVRDVRSVSAAADGRLCIVKHDGTLLHVQTHEVIGRVSDVPGVHEKIIHDRPLRHVFYEDGILYFIDDDLNLFFYDDARQQKMLLKDLSEVIGKYGVVSSITFFHQDLFIAFMHSGLVKLDMTGQGTVEAVSTTIGMFGLLKDRYQDALWVGTDGRGVEMYYNEKDEFCTIQQKDFPFTSQRPVRAFYTDDARTLWIGTKGDGIYRIKEYDRFVGREIPEEHITRLGMEENPVYRFRKSGYSPDLWIGTDRGLMYYSYRTGGLHALKDSEALGGTLLSNVHTFCEVNDSTLWVSSKGLYKVIIDRSIHPYRVKRKKAYAFEVDGVEMYDEYYAMHYDEDASQLFLGSRRGYGVLSIDLETEDYRFISVSDAENRGMGDVICLHWSRDGVLYLGTSSGLWQVRLLHGQPHRIKHFGRNEGIANDMIHGILEDRDGIIWLSTNKGLVKYNPANDSFFNVRSSRIGIEEYADDAYWQCPTTGRLFFGGVNGLVWVEPKNGSQSAAYRPDLLFTELRCFDKVHTLYDFNGEAGRGKVLELPVQYNTFSISFSVLDYVHADNYDFAYCLEGYHSEWIPLQKENVIRFTKLPHGDYVLRVKYKNDVVQADDNIWSLPITVLPPWYLSGTAIVIYFVLIMGAAYLVFFFIDRRMQKKSAWIERQVKETQREKMYKSKLLFFTNITHELCTPLTLINSTLEQMKKETLQEGDKGILQGDGHETVQEDGSKDNREERRRKYIDIMQNNVLSLNELIQEILDFRKLEETELNPYTLKNVSVTDLLRKMLDSYEEMARQNDVRLVSAVQPDLHWYTDRASFKKIVSNLISNAFKYTPVGGLIRVDAALDGEALKITVYNTGRGIEQDKLKTVFNRYRVLENSDVNANNQLTARNGLGLYICYSMTKLLQGDISVDSVVDDFTCFTVVLPNLRHIVPLEADVPEGEDSEPVEVSVLATSSPATKSGGRTRRSQRTDKLLRTEMLNPAEVRVVLVVDDNPDIVELVGDILSPDFQVLKAYSAKEALACLTDRTPDLLITDIMMPGMDGLALVRRVRKDKRLSNLPIIALTAKAEEQDQVQGYEAGVDVYVGKPFFAEVLRSVVRRLLVNKEELKTFYDSAESYFEYLGGESMPQKDRDFIREMLSVVNEHIAEPIGADFLAYSLNMSSRQLYSRLKRVLSVTPSDFIKDCRLTYAAKLMLSSSLSVKEIISEVGISNKSYFYREFLKRYGVSPKVYQDINRKDGDTPLDDE